jgi:hypothetical protein
MWYTLSVVQVVVEPRRRAAGVDSGELLDDSAGRILPILGHRGLNACRL